MIISSSIRTMALIVAVCGLLLALFGPSDIQTISGLVGAAGFILSMIPERSSSNSSSKTIYLDTEDDV